MVDMQLVKELKQKQLAGVDKANPADTAKVFEFVKQLAAEEGDLKDEIEDMETTMQIDIKDTGAKYWVKIDNGKVEFGEGVIENPLFTWIAPMKVAAQVTFGEINAQSAFMAGLCEIKGKLKAAVEFQVVLDVAMDAFKELSKKV